MNKVYLRNVYKKIRNELSDSIRTEKSLKITDKLIDTGQIKKSVNIMIYNSFSSEVKTNLLRNKLLSYGKNILIPKCIPGTNIMYAICYSKNDNIIINKYGITEPESTSVYNGEIDLIIVPGIAFDTDGNRIGFGKGYYDRFINSLDYKPYLIGIAYENQIVIEGIDTDANDVRMDMVVTDEHIYV